ncbi:MAG: lysophospholipid acyltransferase family protein [Fimbriimonadaceae bacterium]
MGPLVFWIARAIGMTLKIETQGYEEARALPGGKVLAGWHGTTFPAAILFRGLGVYTIVSLSKDGEMQDHIFRGFGFKTFRGSTGRGGVHVLKESIRVLRAGETMAFTPDGPRGPSGIVQPGILHMAKRSGAWIVPTGVGADRCWRAPSWDRYLVPKPFARCVMIFGKGIKVPTDCDDEGFEAIRVEFENELHRLQAEAEAHYSSSSRPA